MLAVESIRYLLLISSIVFFVLGFIRPLFMPLAYLVCVFGKLPYYFPFLITYKYEMIIAIVGLIRTTLVRGVGIKIGFKYNKHFYLFLFTVLISFVVSWDPQYSWDLTLYGFIGVIMTYFMILCGIKNERDLRIFVWLFVVAYALITYEPIYYYFTGEMSQEYFGEIVRAETGVLKGHRSLANNMNQVIPIAFFLIFTIETNFKKAIAGVPVIMFISALVLGKARIGIMGFMFFIMLTAYFSEQKFKYGMLGSLIILIFLIFSPGFSGTASRISIEAIIDSQIGLIHGIEMVRVFGNVLGVGPGCFELARGFYFQYTFAAHSLYGELLGDLGIPGTVAWFLLILSIRSNLNNSIKIANRKSVQNKFIAHLAVGLLLSLYVRLFIGLASHSLYIFHWYMIAALSIVIFHMLHSNLEEVQSSIR